MFENDPINKELFGLEKYYTFETLDEYKEFAVGGSFIFD